MRFIFRDKSLRQLYDAHTLIPAYVAAPAEVIVMEMDARAMDARQLAQKSGLALATIQDLLETSVMISENIAHGLAKSLELPAELWLGLEAEYQLHLERQRAYQTITVWEVADYLLYLDNQSNNVEKISNMKLQKLAYYAYGHFCALYNKPLFLEPMQAWQHGPVVYALWSHYRGSGNQALPQVVNYQATFSSQQQAFLEHIYADYGHYSAAELRQMTHEELPWQKNKDTDSQIISYEDMLSYFRLC